MSGNSKDACNSLKTVIKTQQLKSVLIADMSGNILTESMAVLNRRTEYCSGLHNYALY